MKIIIFSSVSPANSGSVAFYLYKNFIKAGFQARIVTKYYKTNDKNIISIQNRFERTIERIKNKLIFSKLNKKITSNNKKYYFFNNPEKKKYFSSKRILNKIPKPDIIFIVFHHGLLNAKTIYELHEKTGAPVYWYLMDMAAMTGGCHYAWNCFNYKNTCGNCPALDSKDENDLSNKNLKYKKKYLDKTNLSIIAGSNSLEIQSKNSWLFKNKQIHNVLLAVSPQIFSPTDSTQIRKKFNADDDVKIIFLGAVFLWEERKGMKYLLKALLNLKDLVKETLLENKILLLIAGKKDYDFFNRLPFQHKYLGYLKHDMDLAQAYNVADVFVSPSIEDSGPMMVNQSLMCGTPVVSFDIGIAKDLIHNNITGFKVNIKDSDDMSEKIYMILSLTKIKYEKMSYKCRELALKKCLPENQIKSLINIFQQRIN